MLNNTLYRQDVVYGLTNEKKAQQHIQNFFEGIIDGEINVCKLKDNHVFDFKIKYSNTYIELKSRRNDINKYPTQMIGANKIRYGRKKMKNNEDAKIYYFYLLEDENNKDRKSLYFYKDEGKDLKLINCGNYKRNDKTSELFLINNTDLTYLCSF